jgi:hypothetical protein
MFTFGLFSTHMPYVVMVVFYALYFLFASPSFNAVAENTAEADEETPELVETAQFPTSPASNFHYSVFVDNVYSSTCLKFPVKEIYYSPPDKNPKAEGFHLWLFSRPPPFLS